MEISSSVKTPLFTGDTLVRCFRCLVVALTSAAAAGAQAPIPVRTIGPILATSTENVGQAVTVRGTSDGHVIVGAGGRQKRVRVRFDAEEIHDRRRLRRGHRGAIPIRTTGLIPYLGDSTLLPDFGANALLVLDATGKQVRSMAPPRAQDLMFLGIPAAFGRPGFDPKGRLIYRSQIPPNLRPSANAVRQSESGDDAGEPRLGADRARRLRHAHGSIPSRGCETPSQGRMGMEMKENLAGGPPSITMHMLMNPFSMADEWSVLSDGTIAIVRVHDYHIDWIDPDGTKRSTPKMPIDWRRYTDAERTQRVDSIRRLADEQIKRQHRGRQRAPARRRSSSTWRSCPTASSRASGRRSSRGRCSRISTRNLWILPTTSTNAANGFTYDVVNRKGEVVERVQLPKDHVLVGFGPRNVVYLTKADGKATYLERALLTGPPVK